jgi:hypothetical protein
VLFCGVELGGQIGELGVEGCVFGFGVGEFCGCVD